ncbi:MAG: UDP-N-acetylmuramate--L-alanine ligase [Chlorobi bacterium]|nr:UDP-N-acetylmuramate--L-alanine ligase [Chlorobiota bacterium]MCI0715070.1 UDP-N-acetylmuramate--L-alanine ligase [Chlorobiota bacterium]
MKTEVKNIHFIGIGGVGVSGLAEYFLKNDCKVSGSDLIESDITKRLALLGAKIHIGHKESNISQNTDTVVFTSAAKIDNPEMVKAAKLGIRLVRRAEMLGEIVNDKFLIAVSGTHGKTTTTAMIGKLLVDAGLDPLAFVRGSAALFEGGSSRFGKGRYAVVEADEYDRSFLTLKPDIAVITNIDEDHLDVYKGIVDIKNTFNQFVGQSKEGGYIVYCGDDSNTKSFIGSVSRNKISYGFDDSNYLKITDYNIKPSNINFSILNSHSSYTGINLNLIGRHNVLNSTACFAVSKILNIGFEKYRESIGGFKTVDRRLQVKYDKGGVKVYDDYAHHPAEISSSLKGLRESFAGRIIIVFQPHLYSRTKDFYKEFAKELSAADEVILMDIYPAREEPIKGVTSELILNEFREINSNVSLISNRGEIIEKLLSTAKQDNIIVFQGAGDVTELCSEFVKKLEAKN